jgi:hypothetical protein
MTADMEATDDKMVARDAPEGREESLRMLRRFAPRAPVAPPGGRTLRSEVRPELLGDQGGDQRRAAQQAVNEHAGRTRLVSIESDWYSGHDGRISGIRCAEHEKHTEP